MYSFNDIIICFSFLSIIFEFIARICKFEILDSFIQFDFFSDIIDFRWPAIVIIAAINNQTVIRGRKKYCITPGRHNTQNAGNLTFVILFLEIRFMKRTISLIRWEWLSCSKRW